MTVSPYKNKPEGKWLEITEGLVNQYPLKTDEILEIALLSWERIWKSEIGGEIKISDVELPATVIGYFFQKLFAHELKERYPSDWIGERVKSDKDLVNLKNSLFSTEMKSSGQMGYSLFGNRSYNQESQSSSATKDKSGYYLTINFYQQSFNLLRLGWIDQDDWVPQGAATGQAAVLKAEVYEKKLVEINGKYRLGSPVQLLDGVGPKASKRLNDSGVYTFSDVINQIKEPSVEKVYSKNKNLLQTLA